MASPSGALEDMLTDCYKKNQVPSLIIQPTVYAGIISSCCPMEMKTQRIEINADYYYC